MTVNSKNVTADDLSTCSLRWSLLLITFAAIVLLTIGRSTTHAQAFFIRGDVDCNGVVNTDDIDTLQAFLFGSYPIKCTGAANVDGVGDFPDAGDFTYLYNYLSLGGPAPPAPFPNCGVDPSGVDSCEALCYCAEGSNVLITTRHLPPVQLNEPFEHILSADGGTSPYT
jgi:hypothetical protein